MSHNNIFVQLPLLVTLNLDRTLIQLFMITYSLNKSADNILARFDYARNPPIENSKNEWKLRTRFLEYFMRIEWAESYLSPLLLEHEKIFY